MSSEINHAHFDWLLFMCVFVIFGPMVIVGYPWSPPGCFNQAVVLKHINASTRPLQAITHLGAYGEGV